MNPLDIALLLLGAAMVAAVHRILTGPHQADRAAGSDIVFLGFVGIVIVLGLRLDSAAVVDLVLVCALIGFLAALSLARLVSGGKR
ncbi:MULTISPECIES: monovalent cation/H+ antiporter complex subunit F [Nocardiopsidaceae]|uniref:Monovalent cation/H+ antiporter complex subunit F n=2 Tax=Nocardiopsidaceae TaxID=83676 RepID=A0ABY6YFH4_9ACTN|nr:MULTISPECIES: monovalent cation/H+ antiporter complex subunit F [Nocardiopsaceae]MEE2046549.1 monovalent cation/H+ antiporter complex subunit F [Nocardiopsis tropica]MEE2052442.1 monovalent cation/H+ antiporter complex subunit F [Nocardiopsis umidischolae]WAE70978.1 monovalent cation/H+ antiporter complex subunit F [Streptomonospora nanhaiensis]